MKNINIQIHNKYYKIQCNKKHKTLLEILESYNIKVEYQCRQGYCGLCKIYLIKGTVASSLKFQPMAYLNPGEILPCCCKIKESIEIKL
ncbi:MAG TPA: class I ribonucleotide reductase maintenance protein YfaE [Buchnera sp. (in: enterobacteria)]|nr:class I ribonucleotide reductase maintenance protein YfaE [Buchnera sp. (in: enterobacteria)]